MAGSIWSLVPPLLAIVLAIATRRIYLSLLLGLAAGAMLLKRGNPLESIVYLCEELLWPALIESAHLRVFAFTLLMGAMVGVIRLSGGMQGAVEALSKWATNRRRVGLLTWLLGMVIFFDDYANTMLLGTSMRPLADRHRISREKLAYIVDSTAAPVAGLALVSTWVAFEMDFIAQGLGDLKFAESKPSALNLFIASIPYRFYVIWALLLVPATFLLRRDLGPMATAEQRTLTGEHSSEQPEANKSTTPVATEQSNEATRRHWGFAALPIAVVMAVTTFLLWATGRASLDAEQALSLIEVFGAAEPYLALVYGSLAGLLTALSMVMLVRELSANRIRKAMLDGAVLMLPALAILTLAWAMTSLTDDDGLQTGAYLGALLEENIGPALLPTLVFVLASIVAFCTGTSWGTMGILMPLAITSTHQALAASGPVDGYDPILVATIGSVLAGAIFGDHCSPISDTTVLSSQASGCNHMAHVTTQLPYALLVGAAAILLGTLPVGFGVPVWMMLPLGLLAVLVVVRVMGKPVE